MDIMIVIHTFVTLQNGFEHFSVLHVGLWPCVNRPNTGNFDGCVSTSEKMFVKMCLIRQRESPNLWTALVASSSRFSAKLCTSKEL